MENSFYLKTTSKKGRHEYQNFGGRDKENCDFSESFPQKRRRRRGRNESLNGLPEGIEKFYCYVDRLGNLLNVRTESMDLNALSSFVEGLNKASPLNPLQLKFCKDFGIVPKTEDPESPPPSNQSSQAQPTDYIPLKSFQSLLPTPYKPFTIPTQLKICLLKPTKYSKQNFKS